MRQENLSVFIITYNSGAKLERCLKSIAWAGDIVIVDSDSHDETLAIAQQYGARIFQKPFKDFSDQKNFALKQTQREWALSIDSDEEVTEELRHEIIRKIQNPENAQAFSIPRRSRIFGREFRFSGTQDDKPIRLMKKNKARFEQPIHEKVIVDGPVEELKNFLIHYTYATFSEYLERFEKYTSREARFLQEKKKPLSWVDFTLRPWAKFIQQYGIQQGFRDGLEGFAFAVFSSVYVLVKYLKYRELQRKCPQ